MKISIIGAAGCIGSSIAYHIAVQKLADEMVLSDIRPDWLEHHCIDIIDACVADHNDLDVRMGNYEDIADSDIVIMAAGKRVTSKKVEPEHKRQTRQAMLPDNLEIQWGLNPNFADFTSGDMDSDFLSDQEEITYGTNPDDADTDGDGIWDYDEIVQGSDPRDPASTEGIYYPHPLPYQTSFVEFNYNGQYGYDLEGWYGWQVVEGECYVVRENVYEGDEIVGYAIGPDLQPLSTI